MADAEIQVLIKVVDELSNQIKVISGNIDKMADNTQSANETIQRGFTETTNQLIAVGNAAQAVEGIFSRYENMQIRLENASLRLENAQERVADSQLKLNRLVEDGKAGTREYQDAQTELERANRGLIISQNNLHKVQGQAIGTYITMGVEVLRLIASYQSLVRAFIAIRESITAYNIVQTISLALTNQAGLVIGLVAAGVGIATVKYLEASSGLDQLNASTGEYIGLAPGFNSAMDGQIVKLDMFRMQLMGILDNFNKIIEQEQKFAKIQSSYGATHSTITNYGVPNSVPVGQFHDFVMRPGQPAANFSPNDTIIGVKNPGKLGGVNVTIGAIYGLNATEISRALKKELVTKMSV